MKALVFGDVHGDVFALEALKRKAKDADVILCLGDLTIFGEGLPLLLEIVNEFPKPVLLIHGNHEIEEEMEEEVNRLENITFIHKKMIARNEHTIIGYGGDGFSRRDEEFEEQAEEWKSNVKDPDDTIVLLHGPPSNTKLDVPFEDHHSGSESYREFIEDLQPKIAFVGHIHECEGKTDRIGNTIIHNPGPEGTILDLEKPTSAFNI